MAALSSYTPISTQTLSSGSTEITFNSFTGYTDLVLVCNVFGTANYSGFIRFNGDTGSNYSSTTIQVNGSSATSGWATSDTKIYIMTKGVGFDPSYLTTGIINIQNYSNSTTYKTVLSRSGVVRASLGETCEFVGTWRNTAAITSFTIISDGGTYASGSTFSLYGIANNTAGAKATGGVISSDSNYFYHSFYATDTFTPTQSLSCDYLVVAGGGGGSRPGGGGGGLAYNPSKTLTTTGYTITIGAGGAGTTGSTTTRGTSGSNSVALSSTATGGGGAGANSSGIQTGLSGGSGGGGSGFSDASAYAGGTGTTGTSGDATLYGNSGGAGQNLSGNNYGGGGGGAGGAGASAVVSTGAAGGIGLEYSISGSSSFYAGGGGGAGGGFGGTGGSSIGGNGKATGEGADGVIGRGGGGGGGADGGGNGGSGVVIIRYAR